MQLVILGSLGMSVANGIYIMTYQVIGTCVMLTVSTHNAETLRFFHKSAGRAPARTR